MFFNIRYRYTVFGIYCIGAAKTKITVIGCDIDMDYYQDTTPWNMSGETVKVVEDNEHLGQIVSGTNQEQKNIDESLKKGRGHLFSLLRCSFCLQMYA